MVGQPGKPPGYPKSGGARKGSIKLHTRRVKDTIKQVFYDDLGGAKYLRKIAANDPALFCSLLARLVPSEIRAEIDVSVHRLDLGAEMRAAASRLAAPMIDVSQKLGDRDVCSTEAIVGSTDRWRETPAEIPIHHTELE